MPISGELIAGALAGLAFVGCSLGNATPPQTPGSGQGRRREVVVNGKRVKTVDIHAHTIVPEAAAVINHPLEAPGLLWSNVTDRIAEMDAEGVDVEALSINPYWYRAERDAAAELIKIQNESSPNSVPAIPTALSRSLQQPCSIRILPPSSWNTRSRLWGCAACRSAAVWP